MSEDERQPRSDAELIQLARRHALNNAATVAPAVLGQVCTAVLGGNWWAAAGWALGGVDVVLIDLGHMQDAATMREGFDRHLEHRTRVTTRTPARAGTLASAAVSLGVWEINRRRFGREFPDAKGGLWSMVRSEYTGWRGVAFVAVAAAGLSARALIPPAVRPGR